MYTENAKPRFMFPTRVTKYTILQQEVIFRYEEAVCPKTIL